MALVGRQRGRGNGRRGDQRRDRNRRDDREGGRRDFKRKSNKIAETLKVKATNVLIVLLMKRKMALSSATKGINKSQRRSSNRPSFNENQNTRVN